MRWSGASSVGTFVLAIAISACAGKIDNPEDFLQQGLLTNNDEKCSEADVLAIFASNDDGGAGCANAGCHNTDLYGPNLTAFGLEAALVNQPSSCNDRPYISANDNYFIEKIDGSRNPSDLMTKHLNDTLQQRHLDYIHARATEGRAETAPELSNIEGDFDNHYLLGTVFPAAPPSILKNTGIDIIEKDERESGDLVSSDSRDRQLPLRHSAISMRSIRSSGSRRRKSVRFPPLSLSTQLFHIVRYMACTQTSFTLMRVATG